MVGAIDGLKYVGIVDSFSLVARKQESSYRSHSGRGRRDRDLHFCYFRSDLILFQSCGCKTAGMGHPGYLADGDVRPSATAAGAGMVTTLFVWRVVHTPLTWRATIDKS